MQTKLFRARSISEATVKVKKSLGPDAMIISTRKLGEGYGDDLFEISTVPGGHDFSGKISGVDFYI